MMPKFSSFVITLVVGLLFGLFLGSKHEEIKSNNIIAGFRERQGIRDSIITDYQLKLDELYEERDSLIMDLS